MAVELGLIERGARGVARALSNLASRLTADRVVDFWAELGTQFPPEVLSGGVPGAINAVGTAFGTLATDLQQLINSIAGTDSEDVIEKAAIVIGDVAGALGAVDGLGAAIAALQTPIPGIDSVRLGQFGSALKSAVLHYALVRDLEVGHPDALAALIALGLVERVRTPADPTDPTRPEFTGRVLHLDRLPTLITAPVQTLTGDLGWGSSPPNYPQILSRLQALLRLMFFQADIQTQPDGTQDLIASTLRVAPNLGTTPPGLDLILNFDITDGSTFTFDVRPGLSVSTSISGEFDVGAVLTLVPPDSVRFTPTPATASAAFSLTATLKSSTGAPTTNVFGDTVGSRIEAAAVNGALGLKLSSDGSAISGSPFASLSLDKGRLVVDVGDGDGFLQSLVSGQTIGAALDLAVSYSLATGLSFGRAGLEIDLPVQVTLAGINIDGLALRVSTPGQGELDVEVLASLSTELGPVAVSIERVGLLVKALLTTGGGNFGVAGLTTRFQPPTGLGIAIDAGSVSGGGFISFDEPNGRYFGALQLSIYDISVSAFGLIETKVPNVDFSFVIVISAQFTPIQLGFGFTLNGVGGMVGINRSIDTTALGNLVRAGQSEELLFPKNVIADAPTIVRDLTTIFPATQGRYIFGPLGKLGWGTPTLITGEIGIILEFPGLVVVILGEVKCLLPKPDEALVKLNLSIDGELDFPNKTFSMDAALHDSVISGFPVSGQMAMRVTWGGQPNFVFSIGGFHPAYTPPANFPKLQPMTLDLGSHGAAKISVSGFFAVTSNTVQVGGSATLHAGGSGITLDASVSVKALFVFQPFSFEADIDASVKISFHGYGPSVHLSGQLDGPSPWHIKGEVCVSIIWWDACLGFDVTFGGNQQVTQPAIDPWVGVAATDASPAIVGLRDALSDAGNWSGALIPGTVSSVTRAQGTATLVDPVGGLTVRQKTAPVETANPLTKFGVANVDKPISFSKVQATLGNASGGTPVALTAVGPVNEFFAPAQFFKMDDGKKLSSAGFEQYQAGYLFATANGNAQGGSTTSPTLTIDTFFIAGDGTITGPVETPPPSNNSAKVAAANKRSAVAKGGLALAGTRRFVNRAFTQAFTENVPTFLIASNATLVAVTGTGVPAADVRSATLIALDAFRAQHLELATSLQVAAIHEAA